MPTGVALMITSASVCFSYKSSYVTGPFRDTTTVFRAWRTRQAPCAVSDVPPLPRMTTFFPVRPMPALSSMDSIPGKSVLSAQIFPSRTTSVLALPISRTAGDSSSQKGSTARL